MMKTVTNEQMSFWEHLDELRSMLIKIILVTIVCGMVAFLFKDELFAVVLAPRHSGFVTYHWMSAVSTLFGEAATEHFEVQLINTGLAEQFIIHVKVAVCAGILCASPYILYQMFRFVSPALYKKERQYAVGIVGSGYAMFLLGVLVSYLLIFPLTFRFLGTYQVSGEVANMITLHSYISTLVVMSLTMGIVFEMPVLAWLFGRMGLLSAKFMRTYRKHAVIAILVMAAVITPTSDVFTLLLVSIPMYLLYETSVAVVAITGRKQQL
ncbi:MAG: twin-arginine translocase subunit TatC [Prevotella sp.]